MYLYAVQKIKIVNNSTEGVSLMAGFISNVLETVKVLGFPSEKYHEMAKDYELTNPYHFVPMQLYNDLCAAVEQDLGVEVIERVGHTIGERAYKTLLENNIVTKQSSPLELIQGVIVAAETMIIDPKNRSFCILKSTPTSVVIQRTQTFNSRLQVGVFKGLVGKSDVENVSVTYLKQVSTGDKFDEYLICWG